MKTDRIILAGLALTAFVSCNKEAAPADGGVFRTDEAYMNIRIAYADKGLTTRAVGDDTNPFYYGTADEQVVNSADFFFYNADGSYVTHVSQSASGTSSGTGIGTSDDVEWKGNSTVVLKGLKSKNYPKLMVVILNGGAFANNLERKPLKDVSAEIVEAIASVGTNSQADWTNFVMTSSSFAEPGVTQFYTTALVPENFQDSEEGAVAHPVVAYVERLAAKVQLNLGTAFDAENKTSIGSYHINGTSTPTELYTKVIGWGLNATAKNEYLYKVIQSDWTFSPFEWNDAANFRSYWCKSTNYGNGTYPDSYLNSTSTPSKNYNAATATLSYVGYDGLSVAPGKSAYCRENTNVTSVLSTENVNSTVTCVLLKTIVTDASGNAQSLALFDGTLYTEDNYKDRVLEKYHLANSAAYIPWVSSDGAAFRMVTKEYFVENNAGDGKAYLTFKDLSGTTEKYYRHTGTGTSAADFTEITVAVANTMINGTGLRQNTRCSLYKDGMMYYSIPIEHLRNSGKTYKDAGYQYPEADYGIVRNHFYNVTINKIEHIGNAVFDPDEEIIPNDEDNTNYNVGAQINILSWKVVNQTVDL